MDAANELAVLMSLRIRGRADAAQTAQALGWSEPDAAAFLAQLQARAAVAPVAAPGRPPGIVALTEAGRSELARLLVAESVDRDALAALYERFLVVDRDLKQAITTWQLADEARKPAAQGAVLTVAAAAGGVAAALAQVAARLAPYPHRIAAAVAAIATGEARFVASPRVDSLHQVWFELHEDLLATLGRSRVP
jgi:hypothetical protein